MAKPPTEIDQSAITHRAARIYKVTGTKEYTVDMDEGPVGSCTCTIWSVERNRAVADNRAMTYECKHIRGVRRWEGNEVRVAAQEVAKVEADIAVRVDLEDMLSGLKSLRGKK